MAKKPKPGGTVQIGGKAYSVLEGPARLGDYYRIMIRSKSDCGGYWAKSESWRGGCGPWRIDAPLVTGEQ